MTITIYKEDSIIFKNHGYAQIRHYVNGDLRLTYPSKEENSAPIFVYFSKDQYDWYEIGDK